MRILLVILSMFLLAGPAIASDDEARKTAEELLSIVGIEQNLEKSIDQMLAVQLQQNPAMEPYKEIMRKYLNKYMSYETLKPDLVAIYAETFTTSELNELVAFYKSKTGRKVIEVMPVLMTKGAQMGISRVQSNIAELQEMIKVEAEKTGNQQPQQP